MKFNFSKVTSISGWILSFLCAATLKTSPCLAAEREHVRFVHVNNPPYDLILRYPNGSTVLKGLSIPFADYIARKLNVSYNSTFATEDQVQKRGNIFAVIDMLTRDEADLTAGGYGIVAERLPIIDYVTFFSWVEAYRLVVPRPSEQHRLYALIRPFDNSVWILLAISLPITVIMMSLLSWIHLNVFDRIITANKPRKGRATSEKSMSFTGYLSDYSLYVTNVLTNHGEYLKMSNKTSMAVFFGFWLLGISVLIYGYSSLIVTSLTVPAMNPAINTLEDLLTSRAVSIVIRPEMYMGQKILKSESGVFKQLAEKIRLNPKLMLKTTSEVDNALITGRFSYPFLETFNSFFIAAQYKKDKECRFQQSNILPVANPYFFPMVPKGSKYKRALSLACMELWETGIIDAWKTDLVLPSNVCSSKRTRLVPSAKQTSIKLVDLTGAFFVLSVGFALSLITFLAEVTAAMFITGDVKIHF